MSVKIVEQRFDPIIELRKFYELADTSGAVVSMSGQVRHFRDERKVCGLCIEHYPKLTEDTIVNYEADAQGRWPLEACLIIHRVGMIAPRETIVLVATAAAHRRDAFNAADFLMDYLKSRAFFWKKEYYEDGDAWIEPRTEDYNDAERWREL